MTTISSLRAALAALLVAVLPLVSAAPAQAAAPGHSLHLEELTWTELRDRIQAGSTTAIIPIGGTEQNGPHMVLGKHNVRVRALAELIASSLGQSVVAPVVSYVPEGSITPPTAHMRYAGTLSIPESAFEALLEGAARSLRQHGFRDIVLLGDHGGYAPSLARVTAKLNAEWAGARAGAVIGRVHALPEYYQAASRGHALALAERGFSAAEIGKHAGLADTALSLAIDPTLVRTDRLPQVASGRDGVDGNPVRATAGLGQLGVDQIVAATVAAIRAHLAAAAPKR